jgi:hypothetical protein
MTIILRSVLGRSTLAAPRVGGPGMCVPRAGAGAESADDGAGRVDPLSKPHHPFLISALPRPHPHPLHAHAHAHSRPARRLTARPAEPETNNNKDSSAPPSTPPGTPPPPTPPTPVKSPREEGSVTAIVTGAISVVIGIAYLALVAAMNNRGELLPPPPEAFGP